MTSSTRSFTTSARLRRKSRIDRKNNGDSCTPRFDKGYSCYFLKDAEIASLPRLPSDVAFSAHRCACAGREPSMFTLCGRTRFVFLRSVGHHHVVLRGRANFKDVPASLLRTAKSCPCFKNRRKPHERRIRGFSNTRSLTAFLLLQVDPIAAAPTVKPEGGSSRITWPGRLIVISMHEQSGERNSIIVSLMRSIACCRLECLNHPSEVFALHPDEFHQPSAVRALLPVVSLGNIHCQIEAISVRLGSV